ncbi:MAG: thioesterase family protein [Planctomycetota bacterium]
MTRRVEFPETDLAGIVHFSNYFRFFESAEHDFFRVLGVPMHRGSNRDPGSDMTGFARYTAACDYLAPLCYDEVFRVRVVVAKIGPKSIDYVGSIHLDDEAEDSKPRAIGRWDTD